MRFTVGAAASAPKPPCSIIATTTSFGWSYGAHEAYQEWSAELAAVAASAVPVLPATLIGKPEKTENEVPLGLFAASKSPCLIAHVYGESFSRRTGLKWRTRRTPFRITASPRCGRTTVPPLTIAE